MYNFSFLTTFISYYLSLEQCFFGSKWSRNKEPLQTFAVSNHTFNSLSQALFFLQTSNPFEEFPALSAETSIFFWDGVFHPSSTFLCVAICLHVQPYLLVVSQLLLCLRELSVVLCPFAFLSGASFSFPKYTLYTTLCPLNISWS